MSKELFQQCALIAKESFPQASNKFIMRLNHQLETIIEVYKDNPIEQFKRITALIEHSTKIYQIQRKTVIENKMKKIAIETKVKTAQAQGISPKEALASIFVTARKHFVGARDSINTMMKSLISEGNGILQQLTEVENISDLLNGDYDAEVAKYLFETGNNLSVKGYPKHIQQIGDIMKRANAWVVSTLRQNGVYVGEIAGYIMRQTHDGVKIGSAGFDAWAQSIMPRLDIEKTFGDMAKLPNFDTLAKAALEDVFKTVTSEGSSTGLNRFLKGRQLHFKSPEAFIEYNKEFGSFDTIYDAVKEAVRAAARQSALVKHLGTNHREMVDFIKKNSDPEFAGDIEDWYQTSLGADERVGNSVVATLGAGGRMLQNLSKLGGSAKAVLLDFVPAIMTIKGVTGKNFLETSFELAGQWIQSVDPKIRKQVAKELAIDLEMHSIVLAKNMAGSVSGELESTGSGMLSTMHKYFFTLNGMGPLTRMNKVASGMSVARNLLSVVKAPLDDIQTKIFNGYSINDTDVSIYKLVKNSDFLSKNAVDKLTVEELKTLFPDMPDTDIMSVKNDAARKLMIMINDVVEQMVPTPGKRERAAFKYYISPNTIWGQVFRSVAQFKMTSLKAFNDTIYQSSLYESRVPQVSFIATRIVLGAALAYTVEKLYEYAASDDENPVEQKPLTSADVLQYAARGGGLGILGDFMFSKHDTIVRRSVNTLVGPLASELGKGWDLMSMMYDEKPLPREMAKYLIYNTPGLGLPFIKPLRDSLLTTTQDYMENILPRNYTRERR